MLGLVARIGFAWVRWKSRHGLRDADGATADAKKQGALQLGVRGKRMGLVEGERGGPPGRQYVLVNGEVDKVVYSAPFVSFRMGPFLDTGRVDDPSPYFGAPKWMWDTGIQLKIRVLGSFEFVLGYGKDLRSGRNSFFSTVE
jgi:hypothetical protein